MFNSLNGKLTHKDQATLHLLTGGIEWEISTTSQSTLGLPDVGEPVKIYTYLYHRDDQVRLFGFSTTDERDLFLNLIRVESLGPKLAVRILSGISAEKLIEAIENEDLQTLIAVPGLGKKTAQKIVLTLKGSLALTSPSEREHGDIITALVGMGFDKKDATKAVNETFKSMEPGEAGREEFERELLTKSIRLLSNPGSHP